MTSPFRGALYFLAGVRLVFRPELRRFVWVPLLVNTVLFLLGGWYGVKQIASMLGWVTTLLPSWLHWLNWLVGPFFIISMVLVFFSLFTALANLIASPFNSYLSAEVEGLLTGNKPVPEDPSHAIMNELEKIFYAFKWFVWFVVLFFIPVVNTLFSPLWFLFSAWIIAVGYCDYPMANHAMDGRAVRRHMRRNLGTTLGFGAAVMLAMMVPVVNCLVMPAAVAGGTVFWLKTREPETHRDALPA
ncbi:MAG: sulfate transporter CysZ [Magnetococcales bacterium]|nr:sulfate transporter CysZ [Magnetococcales bacterium]